MQTPEKTAAALRAQAALSRRAAAVPTTGGHLTTRLLLDIAAKLEREADELERGDGGGEHGRD